MPLLIASPVFDKLYAKPPSVDGLTTQSTIPLIICFPSLAAVFAIFICASVSLTLIKFGFPDKPALVDDITAPAPSTSGAATVAAPSSNSTPGATASGATYSAANLPTNGTFFNPDCAVCNTPCPACLASDNFCS